MITYAEREVFCQALAEGKSQREAGRVAGIRKSVATLCRLAQSGEVQARVAQLKRERHQAVYEGEVPSWLTPAWIGSAFRAIHDRALMAEDFKESMRALNHIAGLVKDEAGAGGSEERPALDLSAVVGWLASGN
jgi:hypothetical protein